MAAFPLQVRRPGRECGEAMSGDDAHQTGSATRPEARLVALGLELPVPAALPSTGPTVLARRAGSLLLLSGHGPAPGKDGKTFLGKVGRDLTLDEGREAARLVALGLLATLRKELGTLNRVDGW